MNVKCPKCSFVNLFNNLFIPYYICKHCQFGEVLYRNFKLDSHHDFYKACDDYDYAFYKLIEKYEIEELIKGVNCKKDL